MYLFMSVLGEVLTSESNAYILSIYASRKPLDKPGLRGFNIRIIYRCQSAKTIPIYRKVNRYKYKANNVVLFT